MGFKLRLSGSEVVVVFLPEWTCLLWYFGDHCGDSGSGHIRLGFWSLSLLMELTRKTVQRSTCLRLIPYFAKLMLESEKCIFAELPSLAEKSRVL